MKIISIVGARPQFIKLAPLSKELRKYHTEIIIHTGQHFDKEMSESFFVELGISDPNYNLNINSGLHGEQTGRMLIEIENVVIKEKPDLIVVFGDTNSTLAGTLVGSKLNIPSVHIEAGLRSFNKTMPEEINRIVADHSSDYLFAPTLTAMKNLELENLLSSSFFTGDIMVDSHKSAVERSKDSKIIDEYSLTNGGYYLLTLHRPYNVDNSKNLADLLKELGELNKRIIFPIHPRTKNIIEKHNLIIPENITLIKPVGYLDFVALQSSCHKILTDSGGIQKEAYILKKPCITLRSETEWVETVQMGWNLLLNPNTEKNIARKIESFIPNDHYELIFGQNVSQKMVEIINGIFN
ncbi:MAG: UDP-N-acetylglucosamine 2-epimerase (non-hydrolyzing) [Bacteroidetes bacterium]|nr:UDP-N-acetylglucosamine 2-epimerase (non-hydrolyzing) [Bacteroidota bacterium]